MLKKIVLTAIFICLLAFLSIGIVGRYAYQLFLNTINPSPYEYDAASLAVHNDLVVADLHADTLNFGVDPTASHQHAHISGDRIEAGGVSVLTFALATEVPLLLKVFDRGAIRGFNNLVPSSVVMGRPMRTWFSNFERGMYLLDAMQVIVKRNPGYSFVLTSQADIERLRAMKSEGRPVLAIVAVVEGMHILDGKIENFVPLIEAGVRMISLTHHFDNEVGGGSGGWNRYGIRPLGRQILAQASQRGVVIDLAHASEPLIDDVLSLSRAPMVVSHGGAKGACARDRNLSDEHIRRIAENGGVVGVGFWPGVLCGEEIADFLRTVDYIAGLVGTDHIALGSDFDGTSRVIVDVAGMPLITHALLAHGYSRKDVTKIMGANYLRILENVLPKEI